MADQRPRSRKRGGTARNTNADRSRGLQYYTIEESEEENHTRSQNARGEAQSRQARTRDADIAHNAESTRKSGGVSTRTAFFMLLLGLLSGALLMFGVWRMKEQADRQAAKPQLTEEEKMEGIKSSLSQGDSVLTTLRRYYPEDLVMYSGSRYMFLPIDKTLKMHHYNPDQVKKLDTGEWQYLKGEKVISHKGIDVSAHQGEIDWQKAAADGVEFAVIRAMYRGYGSGKLVEDDRFRENIAGANAAGIEAGAYVFTQAISREEVEEEVAMLVSLLSPYEVSGPVVVDVEKTAEGTGRMDGLDPALRTELIAYYCSLIEEAGYHPMIYYNIEAALLMLELPALEPYDKWFAAYHSTFYYPYAYQLWQYSDKGKVDGIEGNVDLDLRIDLK